MQMTQRGRKRKDATADGENLVQGKEAKLEDGITMRGEAADLQDVETATAGESIAPVLALPTPVSQPWPDSLVKLGPMPAGLWDVRVRPGEWYEEGGFSSQVPEGVAWGWARKPDTGDLNRWVQELTYEGSDDDFGWPCGSWGRGGKAHQLGGWWITRSAVVVWSESYEDAMAADSTRYYYRAGDDGAYDLEVLLDKSSHFDLSAYKTLEADACNILLAKSDKHTVSHVKTCEGQLRCPMLSQMLQGYSVHDVVQRGGYA